MKHFLHHLLQHSRIHGQSPAILTVVADELNSISWQQLLARVVCAASYLQQRYPISDDVCCGKRRRWFGYECDNSINQIVLSLAIQAIDAVEVPLDCRGGSAYRDACWNQIQGCWLSASEIDECAAGGDESLPESIDDFEHRIANLDCDSPALVLFTSGTTGAPKGVLLSLRNLVGNAQGKLSAVAQRRDDVRLTLLSYAHAYARTCDLGTWLLSGCVLAPSLGLGGWHQMGSRVRPTLINTVPSLASRLLLDHTPATSRLRLLGCGGAAMDTSEFDQWKARGVTVIQGYGMTEASPVICSATPENATPGLVGGLIDGWESRIVDSRLFVRGPHVMLGYHRAESRTETGTVQSGVDQNGWLDTGDLVEHDEASNQFRILGRADDLIVLKNGFKVHPEAVQQRVVASPLIKHAFLSLADDGLELWVDCVTAISSLDLENEIGQQLHDMPEWCKPKRVERFPQPLSKQKNAFTAKGVLNREALAKWIRSFEPIRKPVAEVAKTSGDPR